MLNLDVALSLLLQPDLRGTQRILSPRRPSRHLAGQICVMIFYLIFFGSCFRPVLQQSVAQILQLGGPSAKISLLIIMIPKRFIRVVRLQRPERGKHARQRQNEETLSEQSRIRWLGHGRNSREMEETNASSIRHKTYVATTFYLMPLAPSLDTRTPIRPGDTRDLSPTSIDVAHDVARHLVTPSPDGPATLSRLRRSTMAR